jgi:hypothetical protein
VGSSPASPVLQKPGRSKGFQGSKGRRCRFREPLGLGKSGAPPDPWLSRQNAALKLKGHGVTLDVA